MFSGCAFAPPGYLGDPWGMAAPQQAIDNPLYVPGMDREYLWNQLVDTVDDYFKIYREARPRAVGEVLTEGQIDTLPAIGSTLLEPWRHDSTPGFEKQHATLQSVRRRAQIRVVPVQGGYLIDVAVYKELEDLWQPEHATVGEATLRHDSSLDRSSPGAPVGSPALGWIPQGRDVSLEQQMLRDIQGRLSGTTLVQPGVLPQPGTPTLAPAMP
jgi:hypothetical protein